VKPEVGNARLFSYLVLLKDTFSSDIDSKERNHFNFLFHKDNNNKSNKLLPTSLLDSDELDFLSSMKKRFSCVEFAEQ